MKYALVTGASSGIGQAICIKLALDHHFHILVNYLENKTAAEQVVSDITNKGGNAELIQFNVSIKEDVELKLNAWMKANTGAVIEVIVNNAGLVHDGLLMFMDEKNWDDVVDVKIKGFYNVTKTLLQPMLLLRRGRIVNISSLIGVHGREGQVNYAAANGGLISATKALAKEIGKRNITVNVITPGFINTEMTKHLPKEELKKIIPAGRFGEPEEVADLVSFLVSDKAGYINGESITISGGL